MTNRFLIALTAVGFLSAGTVPGAMAQGAPQTITKVNVVAVASGFRSSKIEGSSVVNDRGDTIGKVGDIVLVSASGNTTDVANAYAILSVGGFLGLGTYLVAVPIKDLQIEKDKITLAGATKDQLKALPPFQYAKN